MVKNFFIIINIKVIKKNEFDILKIKIVYLKNITIYNFFFKIKLILDCEQINKRKLEFQRVLQIIYDSKNENKFFKDFLKFD